MTRVPGHGPLPANSRIMIVGEAPGADEEERGKPFVGKSGWLLDSLLAQSGIGRSGCYVTNVCKYRPPANKVEEWWTDNAAKARRNALPFRHGDHWLHGYVAEGLADLPHEIEAAKPEVVVALGNLALWALTGETGIGNWRGSELWFAGVPVPGAWDWNFKKVKGGPVQEVATGRAGAASEIAVVPTYHPKDVLKMWTLKATVTHDLRARVVGKMGRPELRREPAYNFTVGKSFHHAMNELDDVICEVGHTFGELVCDIETRRGRLVCAGLGWSPTDALCIPFMHVDGTRFWTPSEEAQLAQGLKYLLADHKGHAVGNQNWNYDRQYFMKDPAFGFRPRIDFDTMIAQHLYLPGTPKDLSYLSSLYCAHHRFWKEEGKEVVAEVDEDRFFNYNCLDAVKTWEVWQIQKRLLKEARLA
jgi:uracil-DNA glycosylase